MLSKLPVMPDNLSAQDVDVLRKLEMFVTTMIVLFLVFFYSARERFFEWKKAGTADKVCGLLFAYVVAHTITVFLLDHYCRLCMAENTLSDEFTEYLSVKLAYNWMDAKEIVMHIVCIIFFVSIFFSFQVI